MDYAGQRQDYFDSLAWVSDLTGTTGWGQLGEPTPCAAFDVRRLIGHLLGGAQRGIATARDSSWRDVPKVVTDVADGELGLAYKSLAAELVEAWSKLGAADRVSAPWGPCTAWEAVRGLTVETVTHGWDLAVATGQPAEAPPGVARRCLEYAARIIPDGLRGIDYDPPVTGVGAESPTERLAHVLGHRRR